MPPDQPMPNQNEARTETGELKPQGQVENQNPNLNPEGTKQLEKKADQTNDDGKSLLNQDDKKPEVKEPEKKEPEKKAGDDKAAIKYEPFKAPEGYEFDAAALEKATPLFQELGLNQEQAQKAIDLYSTLSTEYEKNIADAWKQTQDDWVKEIKADKDIGHKLPEVKATISKALDAVLGPELKAEFQKAMDFTGAGNNPAFIRGMNKMASLLAEGKHVAAGNPSKFANGEQAQKGPSALYPNHPA